MQAILYSTLGCHLCENAKLLLWPLLAQKQYRLVEIDISESDHLMTLYGIRIPVLAVGNRSSELGQSSHLFELDWPFAEEDVKSLLCRLENT